MAAREPSPTWWYFKEQTGIRAEQRILSMDPGLGAADRALGQAESQDLKLPTRLAPVYPGHHILFG